MDFSQEAVDLSEKPAPDWGGWRSVWRRSINAVLDLVLFDAVVNIESSHCYESMDVFLSWLPGCWDRGGRLFFADL